MNKVLLVTGGSRGIGAATALLAAQKGWSVAVNYTANSLAADEVVRQIRSVGGQAMSIQADVADEAQVLRMFEHIDAKLGRLSGLVNNAGVYRAKSFLDYSNQDFQDMLDVNLFGVLNFMQACLPGMQERKHGRIINTASTAGKWGSRNQSAYNVSKHAVVGITRCVALEASPYAVTVNAICPGFVQTDMVDELKAQVSQTTGLSPDDMVKAALTRVPLGRILNPSEIAGLAVYLGSAESSGMTGQSIHVDGGMVLS